MKTGVTNLKRGSFINLNDQIYQVQKTDHNYRGRGSATLRVKLRGITNDSNIEHTFKGDDMAEMVEVEVVRMNFLYKDALNAHFMNMETYEQSEVPVRILGGIENYLKEEDVIQVLMHEGTPLSIRPPQSVKLKVTEAEDAIKGDTATSTKKSVVLESGIKVNVPLFIKTGDMIVVNPETGEYMERG